MNIDDLMEAAALANPEGNRIGKWKHYYPVLETLVKKGFSKRSAVRWLAKQESWDSSQMKAVYDSWLTYTQKKS